jgi:hypothetical protein
MKWLILAAIALLGCTKASESSEAKRMPKPPPSASAPEPGDAVRIDVTVDGKPAPPIDGTKLAATPPDFKDGEHRAWRVATLLPPADREGAVIAATGDKEVTIVLPRPRTKSDPVPVLEVNRRGDVFCGLVSADEPFPSFHGRGGRLARPGDPLPRLTGLKRIAVTLSDGGP